MVAIRRLYESIRHHYLNHQPENAQKAQQQDLKKKYRSRREQVRFAFYILLFKCYNAYFLHCSSMHDSQSMFLISTKTSGNFWTLTTCLKKKIIVMAPLWWRNFHGILKEREHKCVYIATLSRLIVALDAHARTMDTRPFLRFFEWAWVRGYTVALECNTYGS